MNNSSMLILQIECLMTSSIYQEILLLRTFIFKENHKSKFVLVRKETIKL